jgi:hypothetical protein
MRRILGGQNARLVPALVVTLVLMVPLAVFGAPALARSGAAAGQYQYGSAGKQYKVTVCHHTHSRKHPWVTITINVHAWQAWQKHKVGHQDTLGACPAPTTTTTATTPASAPVHGHGHDKGHDQGDNDDDAGQQGGVEHGHGHH